MGRTSGLWAQQQEPAGDRIGGIHGRIGRIAEAPRVVDPTRISHNTYRCSLLPPLLLASIRVFSWIRSRKKRALELGFFF